MEFWGQASGRHVIFEGSLAEMLRFWHSELHFWRKSRRNASFYFVFEFQSVIFEGSLAEKLRFWASKLQFWRKSRRKASFLMFKASILKEVWQNCFVFELQSFNFEGSLAEKLRFSASKRAFWRKPRRKASFHKIVWITHQLTTKSLEPQIIWHPNHLNLKSIDNQLIWISNRLTTKSLESQINWQPNHLNLKSIDNHITWSSNQQTTKIIWSTHRLTTESFESQINWQPKSFESQIRWQPNHLTLNSFESDINWPSNQLNSAHSLPIGSLSLETSATALCGRYVIYIYTWWMINIGCCKSPNMLFINRILLIEFLSLGHWCQVPLTVQVIFEELCGLQPVGLESLVTRRLLYVFFSANPELQNYGICGNSPNLLLQVQNA